MLVKFFSIALSGLIFLTQAPQMRASDPIKEDFPQKGEKRCLPPSPTIKIESSKLESETTSKEDAKTRKKRSAKPSSAATVTSSSQPAGDPFDVLLGKPLQPKRDNFVIPEELNIYETLLILFAGTKDGRNNKIYFVSKGMAASFDSLLTGTTVEFEAFLHASKVKANEGFIYLKDLFLIKNPKDKAVMTRAEEIFKGKHTQAQDLDKALTDIDISTTTLGHLLTDSKPGEYKDKNLLSVIAKRDHSEKRVHSTIADHNSYQAIYYVYIDDIQTKFSFLLNLYRRKVQ